MAKPPKKGLIFIKTSASGGHRRRIRNIKIATFPRKGRVREGEGGRAREGGREREGGRAGEREGGRERGRDRGRAGRRERARDCGRQI